MEASVSVAAVREAGPDTVALELGSPEGFDASPGQFVKLAVTADEDEIGRFYILSSPDAHDTLEITVEIDPGGELGPHLTGLEAGDEVGLEDLYGDAHYEGETRAVVLAGGPGVGPAVGIAERALDDGNAAAVVYRHRGEAPVHRERLAALAERGALVRILDPDADLEPAVADALADGGQVFVYGFAEFLDAALAAVDATGGDADRAKAENFG